MRLVESEDWDGPAFDTCVGAAKSMSSIRADKKLTAFVELEASIRASSELC